MTVEYAETYSTARMEHRVFQKARDERNLTNSKIARCINRSESYVCKIMKGERPVTSKIQREFYSILGLPEPVASNGRKTA